MTQTELLNTIRAHIDQQYEGNREKARYDDYYRGMNDGLDKLEQFLDTLPEQPASEGLEREFDEECHRYFNSMTPEQFLNTPNTVIARHFYELGQQNCPIISDNSLEEEINKKLGHDDWLEVVFDRKTLIDFAGHFYALGLNARKDE